MKQDSQVPDKPNDCTELGTTMALVVVMQELIRAVASAHSRMTEQQVVAAIEHNARIRIAALTLEGDTAAATDEMKASALAVVSKLSEGFK